MSYHGQIVVDMDSHVREYEDVDRTYRDFIDPAYRESFERLSATVARRRETGQTTALFMNPQAIIETSDESRPLGVHDRFGLDNVRSAPQTKAEARIARGKDPVPREVHWDPSIRLRDMDRAQIDVSVIFPSHSASYCALRDIGFESALHQALHRYMTHYCAESDGRLRWALTANMRDVAWTVQELTYWAERDNNLIGVLLSPRCPNGRLLDNPDLHPLYQRAQEIDLPILVHGGVLRSPLTAGATELDNSGYLIRAFYQPWAGMTALGALIGGGVFDLFPSLRVGIFETSGGWLPWAIERLEGTPGSRLTPFMKRTAADIAAGGQLFHSIEAGEDYLEYCVDALGEDIWLFATDYPHSGSPWPDGVPRVTGRSDLTERAKAKILGENAVRLCQRLKR
ncbi:MAG: amidohydrolase family protein [Chloroflexi bacterium]|nr:amidohydrolase family protein [Chloroflexota bacterium]